MLNKDKNKKQEALIEPWVGEEDWRAGDFADLDTPCYVVDEKKLEQNLEILGQVQKATGVKILMALKGFSMFAVAPLIKKYLAGTAASSLNEARLGREEFGGEVHVFSPAYTEREFDELMQYADHIIFNSFSEWAKYQPAVIKNKKKISCGLRVNPEHSEVDVPLYDPCGAYSRLGVIKKYFEPANLAGIEGLHFHCLCENDADALERTLAVFEKNFGEFLPRLKWVNFGGGHHITRRGYDRELLYKLIRSFHDKYPHLKIYLEPGEAIALNAGVLVATVLDLMKNEKEIAILDVSAACHMPDVIEEPYRPAILGAGLPDEKPFTYRLGGPSCLAGDIIGDFSFSKPLKVGAKLIFLNMAIYTMVKNTTFNGINLPSIILRDRLGKFRVVKKFGYEDFKNRLS